MCLHPCVYRRHVATAHPHEQPALNKRGDLNYNCTLGLVISCHTGLSAADQMQRPGQGVSMLIRLTPRSSVEK